mmetsp:Transcript_38662/g.116124  ORF Transcript_38662/g.116124 Transcript_38662/m.116124 type:complete len:220 (+) Transcript_38662:1060-1719(+)
MESAGVSDENIGTDRDVPVRLRRDESSHVLPYEESEEGARGVEGTHDGEGYIVPRLAGEGPTGRRGGMGTGSSALVLPPQRQVAGREGIPLRGTALLPAEGEFLHDRSDGRAGDQLPVRYEGEYGRESFRRIEEFHRAVRGRASILPLSSRAVSQFGVVSRATSVREAFGRELGRSGSGTISAVREGVGERGGTSGGGCAVLAHQLVSSHCELEYELSV